MAVSVSDTVTPILDQTDPCVGRKAGKYLIFTVANEKCGVEIPKVLEIVKRMNVIPVAQMPNYMKGTINLRGRAIPVIDLRLKFGLNETKHTRHTSIIVVDVGIPLGFIGDAVLEVASISFENTDSPPLSTHATSSYPLLGVNETGNTTIDLIDMNQVLTHDELTEVACAANIDGPTAGVNETVMVD